MTTADKLKTIAENEEKVYKAGQDSAAKEWNEFILSNFGYGWGARLFAANGEYSDPYNIAELPPINTSGKTDFGYVFYYCDQMTKAPFLDTSSGTYFNYMFSGCSNLTEFPDYDFSNATAMDYTFQGCQNFTTVPVLNTAKCKTFYCTFDYCWRLVTVEGIDFSSCTYDLRPFEYCDHLENLTVNGVIQTDVWWMYVYKLTRESLLSVINALKDYSGTSETMSFAVPSKALDRLTEEDIAVATAKGWTVASTD